MQSSFVSPPVPAKPRRIRSLLSDALRRPGGRKALSVLSVVLFIAGVAMFAYPLGTNLYGDYRQSHLGSQFDSPAQRQQYRSHQVQVGHALTRLIITKKGVDLNVLVVEGTTAEALRSGAGHYPTTPLPGEKGNVGIAGHRTTFGRPFNHLDLMGPGDEVILETPFARYHYKAVPAFDGHPNPWVVRPNEVSVIAPVAGKSLLTLTTCHPKGSAKRRLILRLELVRTEPLKTKA